MILLASFLQCLVHLLYVQLNILQKMYHFQKYICQKLSYPSILVSSCKLSSTGPVTHMALIYHCQPNSVLFGSSAPVSPSPTFTHLPPPFTSSSVSYHLFLSFH